MRENIKQKSNLREHLKEYRRTLPWIMLKELFMIALSTIPYALTVNQLLVPHAIVGGGVTGLCEIIYFATDTYVPIWLSSALINILLLILAAVTVGWRYALRTIWGVLWLTIWLKVIPIAPVPLLTDSFMAVVIGGLFTGLLPQQRFYRRYGYRRHDRQQVPPSADGQGTADDGYDGDILGVLPAYHSGGRHTRRDRENPLRSYLYVHELDGCGLGDEQDAAVCPVYDLHPETR